MGKVTRLVKNTLRPSAFHYVMFLAVVVVLLSVGARYYFGRGDDSFNIKFQNRRKTEQTENPKSEDISRKLYYGDDDPQTRYAERLRDATQIAIALGLYTVRERTANGSQHVIPTIEEVLDGLDKSPLKPSIVSSMRVQRGPRGDSRGLILTTSGAYYISYRPAPLAFEILAAGANGLEDGSIFVVRLPETTGTIAQGPQGQAQAGSYATLFIAPKQAGARVPLPFSPPDVYRAAGWTQEPLHASPLSQTEISEINRFLKDVDDER